MQSNERIIFRAALILLSLTVIGHPAFAQSNERRSTGTPTASQAQPQPATPPESTSVTSLVTDLGGDFHDLASRETALILGIAGGASLAVHGEDAQVTRRFVASPGVETLLEPGEGLGDGAVQIGLAVGLYALGRGVASPRVSLLGADLVRSQIMNTTLTLGIKVAVGRRRPDGSRFSFPSGHTSSSFATATVLQRHLGWRVGLPAYGLAAFVGGSRLQENKHYLSDVIFGAAIGLVSGRSVTIGRKHAAVAVSPFAVPGGGGVSFTLLPHQ